ncbi:MAG: hypothetical protein KIH62_003500 [Candidatus Kerfeldbacteria bacterium]|nr:hypothetical protein [Candidatus Kerfeldbacteria bacterium]
MRRVRFERTRHQPHQEFVLTPEEKDLIRQFDVMFNNVLTALKGALDFWLEGTEPGSEGMRDAGVRVFEKSAARISKRIEMIERALPQLRSYPKSEIAKLYPLFENSLEILHQVQATNTTARSIFSTDQHTRLAAALAYRDRLSEFLFTLNVPIEKLMVVQRDPILRAKTIEILARDHRRMLPMHSVEQEVQAMQVADPDKAYRALVSFLEYERSARILQPDSPDLLEQIQEIWTRERDEQQRVIRALHSPHPEVTIEGTRPIMRTVQEDLSVAEIRMHPVSEGIRVHPAYLAYRAATNELERKEAVEADMPN